MTGPKLREYWIFPGVEAWQSDEVVMNPECVKKHHIHVIEKSAADKLAYAADRFINWGEHIDPLDANCNVTLIGLAEDLQQALKEYKGEK